MPGKIYTAFQPEEEEAEEEDEEHGNCVKIEIASITPVLRAFLVFFLISLAFNMFPTLVMV